MMTTIHIGGKDRPFLIGYRSIRAAFKRYKINVSMADLQKAAEKGMAEQVDSFVKLLHVGLLHGDKDITPSMVEEWIDADEDFDDREATLLIAEQMQSLFNPPQRPAPPVK